MAPIRILGGHDSLDRAQAVVQSARRFMKVVEELLVAGGQRSGSFPLGDVVEHEPRQADKQHSHNENGNHYVIHMLFPLGLQCGLHGCQFRIDRFRGLQFCDLFLQALGSSHAKSIGAAFRKIGPALENIEL